MDLSVLPTAGELMPLGLRAPRWRPGLPCAAHSEIFDSGGEGSGAGLALALALGGLPEGRIGQRSVLWVQDAASLRLNGRPYRPGLPAALRGGLIHVSAASCEDALFALEEGVRCRDLACVIGEIAGNPRALDFTASRRLTLAAEKHGVPLLLVRHDAQADLSSARMRWRARAAPSRSPRWNAEAPGRPAWHAELFRARGQAPGEWILHDDEHGLVAAPETGTPDHGDLAGPAGGRSLAAS
jgi:protein ImuA